MAVAPGTRLGHQISSPIGAGRMGKVYVLPISGNRGKWQVSTDEGVRPGVANGKRIDYVHESTMMVVDVVARGEEFVAGAPRSLFLIKARVGNGTQWKVAADGTRFLVDTPTEHAESPPLTLVQNWTAALAK